MRKINIGMIGLGLMGGSLSIGLQQVSDEYYFIGLDHNLKHTKEALELNLVQEIASSLEEIEKRCDIIILGIPVDGIIEVIQQFKHLSKKQTIIDLGSTKEKISQSIPASIRENFVTAHPMTGTEKFGPTASIEALYTNKVVVLCDVEKSGTYQQEVAKKIFKTLKMKLVYMDAKEHDRHAGFISHMPHTISYALANSVMKQENPQSIIALAGGGFRDMSRIAKSSPNMWEDIFRQNKPHLLKSIYAFQDELQKAQIMIEQEQWSELNSWMKEANSLHDILK